MTTDTEVNYRCARAQVLWKQYARLLATEQAADKATAAAAKSGKGKLTSFFTPLSVAATTAATAATTAATAATATTTTTTTTKKSAVARKR